MALTKQQKQKVIKDLEDKIKKQKSIVFIDFSKVNSKDIFALRKKLKEAGCLLKVAKKTLLGIAFGDKNKEIWQKIQDSAPAQLAAVFNINDEISGFKIVEKFTKESENVKILGGVFEAKFINKEEAIALARIPSREELLARLVGSLSAPISGFINVLQAPLEACVFVIKAFGESKTNK